MSSMMSMRRRHSVVLVLGTGVVVRVPKYAINHMLLVMLSTAVRFLLLHVFMCVQLRGQIYLVVTEGVGGHHVMRNRVLFVVHGVVRVIRVVSMTPVISVMR